MPTPGMYPPVSDPRTSRQLLAQMLNGPLGPYENAGPFQADPVPEGVPWAPPDPPPPPPAASTAQGAVGRAATAAAKPSPAEMRALLTQAVEQNFPGAAGRMPPRQIPPEVLAQARQRQLSALLGQPALPPAGGTGAGAFADTGIYHGPSQMAYPPQGEVKYPIRGAARIRLPEQAGGIEKVVASQRQAAADDFLAALGADAQRALPPGPQGPVNPVTGAVGGLEGGPSQVLRPYEPNWRLADGPTVSGAAARPGAAAPGGAVELWNPPPSGVVMGELPASTGTGKPFGRFMPPLENPPVYGPSSEFGRVPGAAPSAAAAEYGAAAPFRSATPYGPINPATGAIGGMGEAAGAGKGVLDKVLWRGVVPEGATGFARAKAIGGELLGRSMIALPISMTGQALEQNFDKYNTHENPLVNALGGASRGGAAGAMIGGPWGALIGAGVGGGLNLLTGGGAEDVFDRIPLLGDMFGGGAKAREQDDLLERYRGSGMLNPGEGMKQLTERQNRYEMATTMGLTPDLAAEYAFGDTDGYRRLTALAGRGTEDQGLTDAQIIDTMGKYMQVPLQNLSNTANNEVAALAGAAPGYAGSVNSVAPMMQQAANAQSAALMQSALLAPFAVKQAKGQQDYYRAQAMNQGYSQASRLAKNQGGGASDTLAQLLAQTPTGG